MKDKIYLRTENENGETIIINPNAIVMATQNQEGLMDVELFNGKKYKTDRTFLEYLEEMDIECY